MKKFLLLLAGIGAAAIATTFVLRRRREQTQAGEPRTRTAPLPYQEPENLLDLNEASNNDLGSLGLEEVVVTQIVDNRPYRNKLDLISRLIIPEDVYSTIRDRVTVRQADEPVKVA